ncbi:MAG: hypothetical protein Q4A66_12810 [Eubacteriales bacterium]|nr:hypothetical protein [Eubacteriales bacterium]
MKAVIQKIDMCEILHFIGWRGAPVEPQLLEKLNGISENVLASIQPRSALMRFDLAADGHLSGTSFMPMGQDMASLLSSCSGAYLLAATLGAQSERLLIREQARSSADALLLDAVLSAAIEAYCDQIESELRVRMKDEGLCLTDRFSPGYGDMPLGQSGEICEVLQASRRIGLTVSKSGIMIPRKSVTAIMGVSRTPVKRRARGCAGCSARKTCAFAERDK